MNVSSESPVLRRSSGWQRIFKPIKPEEAQDAFVRFGEGLAAGKYSPQLLQSELQELQEQREKAAESPTMPAASKRLMPYFQGFFPQDTLNSIESTGVKKVSHGELYLNYEECNVGRYAGRGFVSSHTFNQPGETFVAWAMAYQKEGAGPQDPALVYLDYRSPVRQGLKAVDIPGGEEISRINGLYFVPHLDQVHLPDGKQVSDKADAQREVQDTVRSLDEQASIKINHDTTGFGEVGTEHWLCAQIGGRKFEGREFPEVAAGATHYGLSHLLGVI